LIPSTFEKNFSLFITKNPQFTVEITLSLQKEKIDISQNHHVFTQLISDHKACAQSSNIKIPFSLAIFFISKIFAGFQNVC
jgi:hypothetical protein